MFYALGEDGRLTPNGPEQTQERKVPKLWDDDNRVARLQPGPLPSVFFQQAPPPACYCELPGSFCWIEIKDLTPRERVQILGSGRSASSCAAPWAASGLPAALRSRRPVDFPRSSHATSLHQP